MASETASGGDLQFKLPLSRQERLWEPSDRIEGPMRCDEAVKNSKRGRVFHSLLLCKIKIPYPWLFYANG